MNTHKIRASLVGSAALSLLLLMGACATSDEPGKVKEEGDSAGVVKEQDDDSGDDEQTADKSESEDSDSDEQATAALGDLVEIGDWDIRVTKVVLNAAKVIEDANQFNDPATGQYVLATYEATYNGDERTADSFMDLTWTFTSADQQIHQSAPAVTPADHKSWPTSARRGGTVKGQAVFDVAAGQVKGGLLTVETYDDDFSTVYADFAIN